MPTPLGTLLASPVTLGSSLDTFGTHFSFLGVGGYLEVETLIDRDSIPVDGLNRLNDGDDLSSGRRRLGMLVYVAETNIIYRLYIPYSSWNILSDLQKVSALSNNNNWEVFQASAGGVDAIKKTYTINSHGFIVGDVIAYDGISYVKALADTNDDNILGIVSEVIDTNTVTITYTGFINTTTITGTSISNNTLYFLSPDTAGLLTDQEPITVGQISKPMLLTQDTGKGIVLSYRGKEITDSVLNGGNGVRIQKRINQPSHGFTVGNVLSYNGSTYELSAAVQFPLYETIGLVSEVLDVNNFVICYAGFIDSTVGMLDVSGSTLNDATTYYLSEFTPGGLTDEPPVIAGAIIKPILQTLSDNTANVLQYQGIPTEIVSGSTSGGTGIIGIPSDGTYDDGYFEWVPTTKIPDAFDNINELLLALAPQPPANLNSIARTSSGTFVSAKLSFGASNNGPSYSIVNGTAPNGSVDINNSYLISGTRIGVTDTTGITFQLNSSVPATLNYEAGAFRDADKGILKLQLNDGNLATINLESSSGPLSTPEMSVSEIKFVTFDNGNPIENSKYRTGQVMLSNVHFNDGLNYVFVEHVTDQGTFASNYIEWVYDSNSDSIITTGETLLTPQMSGVTYLSGVKYFSEGYVDYQYDVFNSQKYVYQIGDAFSFNNRINLSDAVTLSKTGSGVDDENNVLTKTLPNLNTGTLDPASSGFTLTSRHQINNTVLGINGSLGKVELNSTILHPLKSNHITSTSSLSGFLINKTPIDNNLETETFVGEINRLQDLDYTSLSYTNINNNSYAWDSSKNLITGGFGYSTGMLIFNGELLYPNSSYLTTQYGINTGNFDALPYSPAVNANYTAATGERNYVRKFKSNNTTTQSTLSIDILHTGITADFLDTPGTSGDPSGDEIKMEVLIKRSNGLTYGYFNPFATLENPDGVSNTNTISIAGGTRVECTLSTTPRIGNNDIIIIKLRFSQSYSKRVNLLKINNI